jgi:hypothetical protein
MKVSIFQDVQLFIIEGTNPEYTRIEDFKREIKEYDRFFDLYFIEDQLVLISQRYIP